MKRNSVFIFGVLIVVGISALAYAMSDQSKATSGTWRYKTIVTVETPEGIKTGSAVREITFKMRDSQLSETVPDITVKGEAVAVDLGKRGVLFALMKGYKVGADYGDSVLYSVYPAYMGAPGGITGYFTNLKGSRTVVQLSDYPILVAFRDPEDPKTVTPVLELISDGEHPPTFTVKADHFEELFGTGVQLKSIEIEMTDEPVTWEIETWLSWLPEYYNNRFDGNRFGTIESKHAFANSLASGAFSTGREK